MFWLLFLVITLCNGQDIDEQIYYQLAKGTRQVLAIAPIKNPPRLIAIIGASQQKDNQIADNNNPDDFYVYELAITSSVHRVNSTSRINKIVLTNAVPLNFKYPLLYKQLSTLVFHANEVYSLKMFFIMDDSMTPAGYSIIIYNYLAGISATYIYNLNNGALISQTMKAINKPNTSVISVTDKSNQFYGGVGRNVLNVTEVYEFTLMTFDNTNHTKINDTDNTSTSLTFCFLDSNVLNTDLANCHQEDITAGFLDEHGRFYLFTTANKSENPQVLTFVQNSDVLQRISFQSFFVNGKLLPSADATESLVSGRVITVLAIAIPIILVLILLIIFACYYVTPTPPSKPLTMSHISEKNKSLQSSPKQPSGPIDSGKLKLASLRKLNGSGYKVTGSAIKAKGSSHKVSGSAQRTNSTPQPPVFGHESPIKKRKCSLVVENAQSNKRKSPDAGANPVASLMRKASKNRRGSKLKNSKQKNSTVASRVATNKKKADRKASPKK